jgi:hypothetical protein
MSKTQKQGGKRTTKTVLIASNFGKRPKNIIFA